MQLNYIILAHKSPKQLSSLVRSLSTPNSYFYIHIDLKSDLAKFKEELISSKNIIYIKDRVDSLWGDFSLVQATLNGLEAIKDKEKSGHTILLSGQDKALISKEDISYFFQNHENMDFISTFPIPYEYWNNGGLDRLEHYNFHLNKLGRNHISLPNISQKLFYRPNTMKQIFLLLKYFPINNLIKLFVKRKQPQNIMQWHGGSQWWALSNSTIHLIMNYLEQNEDYVNYHKYTHIPDEIFFHTLVQNLNNNSKSIKPSLTYVNWSRKNCDLPVTFTNSEVDKQELALARKQFLFARKFDE